jgi:hypothetical protein
MMTLLITPVIAWAKHGTSITTGDIWRAVRSPLISAIVAAVFSLGVQLSITHNHIPLLRLTLESSAMISSFIVTLLYVMGQKAFYLELIRGILKRP